MDELQNKPRKKYAITEAQNLLKRIGVTEAPISIAKIITSLQQDFNLEIKKLSKFDSRISGFLAKKVGIYDDEEYIIGFSEKHSWFRNRFTIAHEIGHMILGHNCTGDDEDSVCEAEANTFASELLIPVAMIKKDFSKTPNISELSKLYRVSEHSMTIKIMSSKLLKI